MPLYAQGPSPGSVGPPDLLSQVRFDQRLNALVPLELEFRDENGARVQLGDYFQHKPVVLMFAYYECPNLCGLVLNGLAESLQRLKFNVGDEFQVVTVSIDPRDTPKSAANKKEKYVTQNSKLTTGWHFLTGDQTSIDRLAQATGFQYAYDAQQDQYAHPTGLMVLTPEGKISRYFYGIDFPSQDLQFALMEASQDRIGSPIDQVLLRCYHYDPATGTYTLAIMKVVRLIGLASALALGAFIKWQMAHGK
jgi:protein SCO1/2